MYSINSCMLNMHSTKRKKIYTLLRLIDLILRNDLCWKDLKAEYLVQTLSKFIISDSYKDKLDLST